MPALQHWGFTSPSLSRKRKRLKGKVTAAITGYRLLGTKRMELLPSAPSSNQTDYG
ncbi:MAG: hypothetical protein KME45_17330 [Stenomitos rutilans HA7619-LM2]|nr:hypothetical protein [Stenomitos rutilans HA7619-LM2]